MYSREGIRMKLYIVKMWMMFGEDRDSRLLLAESIEEAERIASEQDTEGYDCFEAEEVTEINGYKVIFEKIAK
jgi:hypothetical protein